MKIFITGASGFVGGACATHFLQKGWTVLAMSRSPAADRTIEQLGALPVRCTLGAVSPDVIRGCSCVVHAAAYVEEWGPYEAFYRANVEGTAQLVVAAREAGVHLFLHVSTEAVLFNGSDLWNVDEEHPYPDNNASFFYSHTKLLAEKLVVQSNEVGGMETVVVRPRLIWGSGDKTILPVLAEMVRSGRFMWIGGGHFQTSTTHIANLVYGMDLALENGAGGNIYFVTDREVVEMRSFLTQLMQTAGVDSTKCRSIPKWLARRAADVAEGIWRLFRLPSQPPITRFAAYMMSIHCTINDQKACSELGYAPIISVAEGLQQLASSNRQ